MQQDQKFHLLIKFAVGTEYPRANPQNREENETYEIANLAQ